MLYEQNEYLVHNGLNNQSPYIAHYGVPNMKKGRRRYQNEDGSLTPEGREHYGVGEKRTASKIRGALDRVAAAKNTYTTTRAAEIKKRDASARRVNKALEKADVLERQSDAEFKKADEMYRGLGKNFIHRVRAVSKAHKGEGTEAAKAYIKQYDKASKLGDKAYDVRLKASKDYDNLGMTKHGRQKVMSKNNTASELWDRVDKFDNEKTIDKLGEKKWTEKNTKLVNQANEAEKRHKKQYKEMERMRRHGF